MKGKAYYGMVEINENNLEAIKAAHALWIIKREDEAGFPEFKNYKAARKYFKKRYGEQYNYGACEELFDGEKMYFDDVLGQPVQISEDGFVHVVY